MTDPIRGVSRLHGSVSSPPHHFTRSSPRAYAQLLRLPNVFTALADICLGWLGALAAGVPGTRWPSFACLLFASASLYSAGMVWNDFFDIEQDRRERPFRPLPSGRIVPSQAARIGLALFGTGLFFGFLADSTRGADASRASLLLTVILLA